MPAKVLSLFNLKTIISDDAYLKKKDARKVKLMEESEKNIRVKTHFGFYFYL
jgi:hypothetical protein